MSLDSQQRGLFIVVSRKRERSPSARSEQSLLLAPRTPPAAERTRVNFVEEEEDDDEWDVTTQAWGPNYASEIHEPHKKSRIRPWWAAEDDALLLAYRDLDDEAPSFSEESPFHLPLAMSAFDLAAEDSYNIGVPHSPTVSGLFSLSREDIEDIANAAAVTASPSTPRPADHRPAVVQPAPAIDDLQSRHPEDEEPSNPPGHSNHHRS